MGEIQKQSIQSTFIITAGFALGAFNIIFLQPKILLPNELGLTRVLTDAALTLATLCTFGSLPIIYKFFPFYKSRLSAKKNDLPFLTLAVCLAGFVIMCIIGLSAKDIIVRKFSGRSPLFVQYSYLVYPFSFFLLLFMWMESFGWSFKKGVISNTLRETAPRLMFTILLVLLGVHVISLHKFFILFSLSYIVPVLLIFYILRRTRQFLFNTTISQVTYRMGGKMINFGLFLFGAQFLNLLSKTADTFILTAKSPRGLTDTAVFTIATYVVTLMEIPQRSMNAITVPVLSGLWKDKNLKQISNIYTKSVTNLLVIGLAMFSLTWINVHNLASYLGKQFSGIEPIILLLATGKLIDLGTGTNAQIIGTSNYWKVDFTTNVIYTLLALPLNYILIAHYGLMGAAYSSLISLTFYNLMRFGFLWYQFKLQPYKLRDLLAVVIAISCTLLIRLIPVFPNFIIDALIRTTTFCVLFTPALYMSGVSQEFNELVKKYADRAASIVRK